VYRPICLLAEKHCVERRQYSVHHVHTGDTLERGAMEGGAKTYQLSFRNMDEGDYEGVAELARSKNVDEGQVSVSSGGDTFTYGQSTLVQTRLYLSYLQGRF